MTPREIVRRAIAFQSPPRLPRYFPGGFGNDFSPVNMWPSPDYRPYGKAGVETDEWGAVWENIGVCRLGEVREFPLADWDRFPSLKIPDIRDPKRWACVAGARQRAGDAYLLATGVSLYERAHFLRGLENVWTDIHDERERLERLLDILVDMNLYAIERYKAEDPDGYFFCDDWGLQDRLMIAPASWREIWKPRYAKVYRAAHEAGMQTLLHSCGDIVSILDDLIEVGLDVIQMDQQENMGLDQLSRRFKGRIAFWCPVDIQSVMCRGSLDDIRAYCWTLADKLGSREGGFLPMWYADPTGAGHSEAAVNAMCAEFLKVSDARFAAT